MLTWDVYLSLLTGIPAPDDITGDDAESPLLAAMRLRALGVLLPGDGEFRGFILPRDPEPNGQILKRQRVARFVPVEGVKARLLDLLAGQEVRLERTFPDPPAAADEVPSVALDGGDAIALLPSTDGGVWVASQTLRALLPVERISDLIPALENPSIPKVIWDIPALLNAMPPCRPAALFDVRHASRLLDPETAALTSLQVKQLRHALSVPAPLPVPESRLTLAAWAGFLAGSAPDALDALALRWTGIVPGGPEEQVAALLPLYHRLALELTMRGLFGAAQEDFERLAAGHPPTARRPSTARPPDAAIVEGVVTRVEQKPLRTDKVLLQLDVKPFDGGDAVACKAFLAPGKVPDYRPGQGARITGRQDWDRYAREDQVLISRLDPVEVPQRTDPAAERRMELHAHTTMSTMDGVVSPSRLVQRAAAFGHKAVAITDHAVVQGFPEAHAAGRKHGVRVIFGMEGYLPVTRSAVEPAGALFQPEGPFVALDLETSSVSPLSGEILEIGAVRFQVAEGTIVILDRFHAIIKPVNPVPKVIYDLTGLTPGELAKGESAGEVLPRFAAFLGDSPVVAHNARFDAGFLRVHLADYGCSFDPPGGRRAIIDTLTMARALRPDLKNHKLDTVCKACGVDLLQHHRAHHDAEAAGRIFASLLQTTQAQDLDPAGLQSTFRQEYPANMTALVRSQEGLRNLYELVSLSHLEGFARVPRIRMDDLARLRNGLLFGTGLPGSELFEGLLRGDHEDDLLALLCRYDYVEILPPEAMRSVVQGALLGDDSLARYATRELLRLADRAGLLAVAVGNVHYLDREDQEARRIVQRAAGGVSEHNADDALHFRTTDEMLEAFAFLGFEAARRLVIDAPRAILDRIEEGIQPVPDGLHAPVLPEAEETVRQMAREEAMRLYGHQGALPPLLAERLERELSAIIGGSFAVVYYAAHRLVKQSMEDGYLAGSRGSVGSSIVATLMGITEVNPLPPHYRCPQCRWSEFVTDGSVGCGYDLPNRQCPKCDAALAKDGQDIPFETFMGFKGDKVPDIDLNFSGENQGAIHRFTETLFGPENVFRAGTITTVAERTAIGLVKGYLEDAGRQASAAEVRRLAGAVEGVKKTTGQHPGGVMVVPATESIYRFTPVQRPANDASSDVVTTHFDYHSIEGRLLKLDILGHDDPTALRILQNLTGVDPRSIPMDDPATLSLFSTTKAIGKLDPQRLGTPLGVLAVPEFNTPFVRNMLLGTRPRTFAELVRISGLSHGTDVWANNAQVLVEEGIATLSQVIATRDDIMTYLIHRGLPPADAFRIMEQVRKGKGLKPGDEEMMRGHGVPDWYIASAKRISYMFPKAHAAAYVMMAFRIAWFKVHYPLAFYAAFYSARAAGDLDAFAVRDGLPGIEARMAAIQRSDNATPKDKSLSSLLEVAREMYLRGFAFLPVDLEKSDAMRFIPEGDAGLRLPFISLPGLGEIAAGKLVEAREQTGGAFASVTDLKERSGVSQPVIKLLREYGAVKGLTEGTGRGSKKAKSEIRDDAAPAASSRARTRSKKSSKTAMQLPLW